MIHELTEDELLCVQHMADAFWDDLRVMQYGNAVIVYVESHRTNFDYPTCIGVYDDASSVVLAVLTSREYARRPLVSARQGSPFKHEYHHDYIYKTPERIAELCEGAAAYFAKYGFGHEVIE